MMGGGGFLWALVWIVAVVPPFWMLLPRYGVSKYFAPLAVLPAIALVLLWIVALKANEDPGA